MTRSVKASMRRLFPAAAFILAALLFTGAIDVDMQRLLRGQEVLVAMYKAILTEYVDPVPPDELLRAASRGMFSSIDPYAELIEDNSSAEMDILNRGAYGGLGIKVLTWNGQHYVSFIYDAVRDSIPLKAGDVILRVDSTVVSGDQQGGLRNLLRGQPGTQVRVLVRRAGVGDTAEYTLTRRTIDVAPVPYAEEAAPGIAYVKLSRFSRFAADSVRAQLLALGGRERIRGVVLDLRDNPGGLLESAVSVMSTFVDMGTPVVSMRGRNEHLTRDYVTTTAPLLTDIPMVLLVNRKSASASEIVAGAVQDLDRGVLLGTRTFGKGLVQTVLPLGHRASLKLTTARYYIPSGRCIQRMRYVNGKAVQVESTDSTAAVFSTRRLGRLVRESTGITPDVRVTEDTLPPFLLCLANAHAVFRFAASRVDGARSVPPVDRRMMQDFTRWCVEQDLCGDSELQRHFDALMNSARHYALDAKTLATLRSLQGKMRADVAAEVQRHWTSISRDLELEFALQRHGEREYLRRGNRDDAQLAEALRMLGNAALYQATLEQGPDY
ncbi:MAG TPA: S41 family peptidase [Bacteroidota bacterium]|nr:S41 family peptidase [Bacteroidota bacterium]